MATRDPATSLYLAAQVRELDRRATAEFGVSGDELMERAGRYAFEVLRVRWPRASRLAVLCGPGNNGGDGYVLARLAEEQGREPLVLTLGTPPRADSEAARARASCAAAGITIEPFDATLLASAEVIVDALLGTGLKDELRDEWRAAVEAVNATPHPVLALDIPSGLDADTGAVLGVAVRADVTTTFVALKVGLFTGAGPEHCGRLYFGALELPPALHAAATPFARRMDERSLHGLLPVRARDAHKGDFGHLFIVGGERGMPGAAQLAAAGAARAGAGLVTVLTHPAHAPTLNSARPELIVHALRGGAALARLSSPASAIVLGPGLGRGAWGKGILQAAVRLRQQMVVDADALFFLAGTRQHRDDWVLTPHPGEAARLLGTTAREVQRDRYGAARAIARRHGGVCVLKGAGTVIAEADGSFLVCDRGNPGLASGGSGDVLAGVIGALLTQGLSARDAARLAVWAHAVAGDRVAARNGEIGMLASDLPGAIRAELNRLADAHA